MINREEYIEAISSNNYFLICFEYYLEKEGKIQMDFNTFVQSFQMYQQVLNANPIQRAGDKIVEDVINYYNKKFNIIVLTDKNGNIVKLS